MTEERIVNRNPYLFGPGPVRRVSKPGVMTSYGRMPPLQGFTMAAIHGMIFAVGGALGGKGAAVDTVKIDSLGLSLLLVRQHRYRAI